jgi:hypothetical protein
MLVIPMRVTSERILRHSFAMPLFNWSGSSNRPTVSSGVWTHWVVTIPATIVVLGICRMWYVFIEWRQALPERISTYGDFVIWTRLRNKKARWGRRSREMEESVIRIQNENENVDAFS